jgi:hypothetical protein
VATPWSALIGFGLVGLGLANVIPIVFSAAGRVPGVPAGTALAAVASTGYAAYLAGPPMIGLAAGVAGLPAALAIVVACCVVIAAQANTLPAPMFRAEFEEGARRRHSPTCVSTGPRHAAGAAQPAIGPPDKILASNRLAP